MWCECWEGEDAKARATRLHPLPLNLPNLSGHEDEDITSLAICQVASAYKFLVPSDQSRAAPEPQQLAPVNLML